MNTLITGSHHSGIAHARHAIAALAFLMLGGLAAMHALAQTSDIACGSPFDVTSGPFDYRGDERQALKTVETHHFTPQVESLISGITSTLGGDIGFTLRVFPNHHRALIAMMNLGARLKDPVPPGARFSVECYFKRALQFRPDDSIARMIYAKYLAGSGRRPDAVAQLEYVAQADADNGFTQYNVGLIFFELGDSDKALAQAHRSFKLGFERPQLKQQLQSVGKWIEPSPQIEVVPAAASPAASGSPR